MCHPHNEEKNRKNWKKRSALIGLNSENLFVKNSPQGALVECSGNEPDMKSKSIPTLPGKEKRKTIVERLFASRSKDEMRIQIEEAEKFLKNNSGNAVIDRVKNFFYELSEMMMVLL